jgi:hypothetical protein
MRNNKTMLYKTRPSSEKKGVFSFKNFWEKIVLFWIFIENKKNGKKNSKTNRIRLGKNRFQSYRRTECIRYYGEYWRNRY